MGVYNENRDKNNSIRDEIREQNMKLKDAPFKEKLLYFKEYYLKGTIAVIIVLAILGNIAKTIINAPRETVFGALFFNSTGDAQDTTLLDSFIASLGVDMNKKEAFIDPTYTYSQNLDNSFQYESSYLGIQKAMALLSSKDVEVMACDQEAFDYFARSECFHNLTDVLPKEILEKYNDKIYYFEDEKTGEKLPLGINVNDAPKLIENHYFDYSEPILGFVANTERIETAIKFLEFIYE